MDWQPAGQEFSGGTVQAQALRGRRVRCRQTVRAHISGGPDAPFRGETDILSGQEGFVGGAWGTWILLAFREGRTPVPASLNAMLRAPHIAVAVDWLPFQTHFDLAR